MAARGVAERALQAAGSTFDDQLTFAFVAILAREPAERERQILSELYARRRTAFTSDPASATALVGSSDNTGTKAELADRAAWVLVANVLLNLN